MKKKYNELLQKQKVYFAKMQTNMQDFELKNANFEEKQRFVESNYGLSTEDIRGMMKTKKEVDALLEEMKLNGIYPTSEEMLNGFGEVN